METYVYIWIPEGSNKPYEIEVEATSDSVGYAIFIRGLLRRPRLVYCLTTDRRII